MRLRLFSYVALSSVVVSFVVSVSSGCSSTEKPAPAPLVVVDDPTPTSTATADTQPPPVTPPPVPDAGPSGRIYVQDSKALSVYDPYTKAVTFIGKFNLPDNDSVSDIAVDRDGQIYGVSFLDRFVRIDPASGAATEIARGPGERYPILLTFVPRGTLDPASDALVGFFFETEDYVRIDTRTGAVTTVGTLNAGSTGTIYTPIGDLVSAGSRGVFLTVEGNPDAGGDLLLQIEPKTGRRLKVVGPTGRTGLYALGYWGGKTFGFTKEGEILEVDLTTAKTKVVKKLDREAGSSLPVFLGAGSTTTAPDMPVPP